MIFNRQDNDSYHAGPFSLYKTLSSAKDSPDEYAEEFVSWVQPMEKLEEQVVELSVIDQAVVRCWSSYVLCFQMPAGYTNSQVFDHLQQGLRRTIDQFPFIAGNLVDKRDSKEGSLEVLLHPDSGVSFGYRDISKLPVANNLNFEKLRQRDFPPSMIESLELRIAPDPKTVESMVQQPVFLAQATFVRDGVLLFFAHSHQIADVTGTNSIMRTWSQNMSAAAFNLAPTLSQSLRDASLRSDRQRLSDGDNIDPKFQESSFPMLIERTPSVVSQQDAKIAKGEDQNPSTIWHMNAARLQELKDLARPLDKNSYISTLDAVNALMWRAICRARRLKERNISTSRLFFVCDVRSKLSPPIRPDSTCNATMKLHAAQACADIQGEDLAASLASAAGSIRQAICDFSQPLFETWISYVKSAPSFWALKAQESLREGPDVVVTDHSKVSAYQYEWGPLGCIERIRNPWWARSTPKPYSQVTLMPRLRDGSLEILTNFEEDINQQLRADAELTWYALVRCR
ncbi:hypothetical protein H2198_001577 [Neophaeococcomyces mojaviensis]|uniref:Uncharacterized protein n=1 Tax=Neophaeococcomyces mojaviensis TaxID=3383035 RepID=A0ACC3AH24_9EURO|nr:hypothetical protein H2198_001577 [Knufia sp. JES_112]